MVVKKPGIMYRQVFWIRVEQPSETILAKLNLRSSLDYDLSRKLQFKTDIMFTRYDQNNTYDVEDGELWGLEIASLGGLQKDAEPFHL